jgi:hypothetical protein
VLPRRPPRQRPSLRLAPRRQAGETCRSAGEACRSAGEDSAGGARFARGGPAAPRPVPPRRRRADDHPDRRCRRGGGHRRTLLGRIVVSRFVVSRFVVDRQLLTRRVWRRRPRFLMVLASLQARCPASKRTVPQRDNHGPMRSIALDAFPDRYSPPSTIASAHAMCPSKPSVFAMSR